MSNFPQNNFSSAPKYSPNFQTFPTPPSQLIENKQNTYQLPSSSVLPMLPPSPAHMQYMPPPQFISPPQFFPPAMSCTNIVNPNIPSSPLLSSNIPPWKQPSAHLPYQFCATTHQDNSQALQSNLGTGLLINETKSDPTLSEDEKWVNSWLNQTGKLSNSIAKEKNTSEIKIHEIKELLSAAINIMKELENASVTLNVMLKSVSNIEWERKCQEIDMKKEELSQILHVLNLDPGKIMDVAKKLKRRKGKRDRVKRQNLKRKEEKSAREENRVKLHQQIDSWMEEMKENVERIRREEELKREADSVLWEVTQKKSEAKKQISLLTSLLQLRDAKATALRSSGKYVLESEIVTFNTVIDKLKTMWERQLEGYLLEEQGLRVMLTGDAEKKNTKEVHAKHIYQEWETAIFGSKLNDTTGEPRTTDEFLEVRRAWDHFVVDKTAVMASTIPVGWVLPDKPSDENWAKCLKHSK